MPNKRLVACLFMIAALLLTAALSLAASAVDPSSAGLQAVAPVTSTPTATSVPPTPVPSIWTGWDPGDGRINPEPAAPLAIYCGTNRIYAHLPSGQVEFTFSLSELSAQGQTLLTQGANGSRLYRLETGQFQVNMIHGGEEYVFTWDACPPSVTTTRVYDVATRALLSVFTRPW